MADEKEDLILVTGASGFIALHIIQLLQREGYHVRGTVRSLKNEDKVKPLRNICPDAKYPLELVEADLTSDAGWDEAVKDCRYVMHVASPFPNAPPKSEDDLIIPAVEGTIRVLRACVNAGSVKRIILTSSGFSIHGETTHEEGAVYTEEDWSDTSSPALDAYAKSKTLAEKAAWEFIHELPSEKKVELAVINPSFVLGPSISDVPSTSLEFIKRLMDGSMPMIPRIYIGICDVRDVALAHFKAMITPEAADKRHLINSSHLWLKDMAEILKKEFGSDGYCIPSRTAPYVGLWFYGLFDPSTKLILPRIGKTYTFSNQRMKEVLKIEPRKPEETLTDTVKGLIECGVIKKPKKCMFRN